MAGEGRRRGEVSWGRKVGSELGKGRWGGEVEVGEEGGK